ncbi:MAG: anaerobic ribonucleoside-triphosphate reductase [Spirochaetota bacterium]|jgi:ribonucleoside-triphosphate reductase|nr:anaerobic ribonucleoside-triphosphate reductase [Spirochaetota bacterium]NMA56507.1 hypothetical protein [Treponema sp.]
MATVTQRNVQTIEAEIAQKKEALQNVRGRETEVYARIVGYYRSVRNWNKGKREEYDHRKMFEYENDSEESTVSQIDVQSEADFKSYEAEKKSSHTSADSDIRYEFFSRRTCPNCPAVQEYLETLSFSGKYINVDSAEGLERARELQILSAPTVVIFNEAGDEVARAQSVKELTEILEPALTAAS